MKKKLQFFQLLRFSNLNQKIYFLQNKILSKINFCPKAFFVQNHFFPKSIFCPKSFFVQNQFLSKIIFCLKSFIVQNQCCLKSCENFCQDLLNIFGHNLAKFQSKCLATICQNFCSKSIFVKNIGSNFVLRINRFNFCQTFDQFTIHFVINLCPKMLVFLVKNQTFAQKWKF